MFDINDDPAPGGEWMDRGTPLTLIGPLGSRQLLNADDTELGGGIPNLTGSYGPVYLVPGAYTVDNGNGSSRIGPYRATLTLPTPPVWTNQADFTAISRSQDITVTWTGADPEKEYVLVTGLSNKPGIAGQFVCAERASAGRFTVPAMVVSTLPASGTVSMGGQSLPTGWLRVDFVSLSTLNRFRATGLDVGFFGYSLFNIRLVSYQ